MRQGPTPSATLFPVGTKQTGNDGNTWVIKLTNNNVKRWVKYKDPNSSTKKTKRISKRKSKRSSKKKSKRTYIKKSKRSSKKKSKRTSKKKSKRTSKRKSKRTSKRKSKRTSKKKSKRTSKKKSKRSSKRKSKRSSQKKSKSTKKSKQKPVKKTTSKRKSKSTKKPKQKSVKKSRSKPTSQNYKSHQNYYPNSFSVMLAHKYNGQHPVGMCVSEKLDGYRAILSKHGFMSRNNKPFVAPDKYLKEILDALPPGTVLDGELYTKRGDFAGMGVVRKKIPIEREWNKITYMVFDLPMMKAPFEERYQTMKQMLKNVPHVKIVDCVKVTSVEQFQKFHKNIVSTNGEGTMLRNAQSYYEGTRSHNLLKVKDFLDDEVIVQGMEFGDGRNSKVMGHLIVKWHPNSKQKYTGTFDVGSGFTDEERQNWKKLFKKGVIFTIQYFEINKESGRPRFPTFKNIRHSE